VTDLALLLIASVFINHFVLAKFLGLHPLLGVSRKLDAAYGMALATGLVLTLSLALSYLVQRWLLEPLRLDYLRTLGFILVIAAVALSAERAMHRRVPLLQRVRGIFLPLIAINCTVLGVALLNLQAQHSLFEAILYGFGAALGFGLVLILFAAMCERLDAADIPTRFRGAPIELVTAALMALAFMGFAGLGPS
jgi:electron transport complex protein RnfA